MNDLKFTTAGDYMNSSTPLNEMVRRIADATDAWIDQLELTDQNECNALWDKKFTELMLTEAGLK